MMNLKEVKKIIFAVRAAELVDYVAEDCVLEKLTVS